MMAMLKRKGKTQTQLYFCISQFVMILPRPRSRRDGISGCAARTQQNLVARLPAWIRREIHCAVFALDASGPPAVAILARPALDSQEITGRARRAAR